MYKKPLVPRKEYSPAEIKARWDKKKEQIEVLSNNIRKLRYNVTTCLKSDTEKVFLKALVVALQLTTGERIGNKLSSKNGHFGVTYFKKKHFRIEGNKIHLKYVGKSGVEHEMVFTDEKLATGLKKAMANSKSKYVFETSDGFRVKGDSINRYLSEFGIRSKDIRGYSSNNWMIQKLKNIELPKEESEEKNEALRKKLFLKTLREVARKVGHGSGTLRNHYLIPELEVTFIQKAKIIDLTDRDKYEDGGTVKARKVAVTQEEKLNKFMKDGIISTHDLKGILDGEAPDSPIQKVGSVKLRKLYGKSFYRIDD